MRNYIVELFISLALAAVILFAFDGVKHTVQSYQASQGDPTLAECLSSIQQEDARPTEPGGGIAYESFICETADYLYVITRDKRGE